MVGCNAVGSLPMATAAFNQLTAAEAERLDMLQEEAAEVIRAVAKIKRHGWASYNPDNEAAGTNRRQLISEMTDFRAVWVAMVDAGDIDPEVTTADVENAWQRKLRYSHHQVSA
jgi:NTP pyrophosphatase (non-canonical NTP hydrolase)